jgi:hypothetical protein
MPWIRKGRTIYKKTSSGLKKKQTCSSAEKAKGAMRLLYGLESGSIKSSEVGKRRRR